MLAKTYIIRCACKRVCVLCVCGWPHMVEPLIARITNQFRSYMCSCVCCTCGGENAASFVAHRVFKICAIRIVCVLFVCSIYTWPECVLFGRVAVCVCYTDEFPVGISSSCQCQCGTPSRWEGTLMSPVAWLVVLVVRCSLLVACRISTASSRAC